MWYDLLVRSSCNTRHAHFPKKIHKEGTFYKNSLGMWLPRLAVKANPAAGWDLKRNEYPCRKPSCLANTTSSGCCQKQTEWPEGCEWGVPQEVDAGSQTQGWRWHWGITSAPHRSVMSITATAPFFSPSWRSFPLASSNFFFENVSLPHLQSSLVILHRE